MLAGAPPGGRGVEALLRDLAEEVVLALDEATRELADRAAWSAMVVQEEVARERQRLAEERQLEREALVHSLLDMSERAEDIGEARGLALGAVVVFEGEPDRDVLAEAAERRPALAERVAAANRGLRG